MRTVLYFLGKVMRSFSFFLLIPIIYGSFAKEPVTFFIWAFFTSFIGGLLLSSGISFFNIMSEKPGKLENITLVQGFMLTGASFIALTAISSIPFQPILPFFDSIFEAASGITTTGMSVIPDLDLVPKSILLWRSLTQWIGGVGIIIVFFFIIYRMRISEEKSPTAGVSSSSALYSSFLSERMDQGIKKTAQNVLVIYLLFTATGFTLLIIAGLGFFEATNISLASISTGGFTITNTFSYEPAVLIVISLLMILGSTSFFMHHRLLQRRFKEFFGNVETKLFAAIVISFFLISLLVYRNEKPILFDIISALTTTGFSTTPITILPHIIIFLLMVCMIIGGSMGSTSGGIKLFRLATILHALPWMIRKLSAPKTAIIPFKIAKKPIDTTLVLITEVFVTAYILFALAGTLVFMLLGYTFLDSSFQTVSALSTVGLATMPIDTLPIIGKMFLILAMLLGRLEFFPLIILARKIWG